MIKFLKKIDISNIKFHFLVEDGDRKKCSLFGVILGCLQYYLYFQVFMLLLSPLSMFNREIHNLSLSSIEREVNLSEFDFKEQFIILELYSPNQLKMRRKISINI